MERIDNSIKSEIFTIEVKSEQLISAMEFIHGIYYKKEGCVFFFKNNKKHLEAANILVVKRIKILTVCDKEVKTSEGNQKSVTVEQKQATGPYFECAPSIKANNHKADSLCYIYGRIRWVSNFKYNSVGHHTDSHFIFNVFGGRYLDTTTEVMFLNRHDRVQVVPESWMYQPFIDYTNENTNRA